MAAAAAYGGQAVMEGVMMRGPAGMAVAVRAPDGRIAVDVLRQAMPAAGAGWWRLPLLRGLAALGDSLALGMRALLYSAELALEPGGEGAGAPRVASVADPAGGLVWSILVAGAFGVALFVVLPAVLAGWLRPHLPSAFTAGLAEGAVRLLLLLAYVLALGAMREIRAVLEFHGAEHKALAALEAGLPLQADAAAACSRFHPRCGTSFLFFAVLIASLLFSLLGWQALWLRVLLRLALLPVVAAAGYEVLRASARGAGRWTALVTAPGLWLQRLTTREPSTAQVEVALIALRRAMALVAEGPAAPG